MYSDSNISSSFERHVLTSEEKLVLQTALLSPIVDRDAVILGICLKLCGRRLLQRAGTAAYCNGWLGSPHAFCLTREGWSWLKKERARARGLA